MNEQTLLLLSKELETLLSEVTKLYRRYDELNGRERDKLRFKVATLKLLAEAVVPSIREFLQNDEILSEYFEQRVFAICVDQFLTETGITLEW